MSEIINPTQPESTSSLPDGGLDIRGFKDKENRLEGTEESDSISGGNLADILSSMGGDDTIQGLDDDDTIFGGDGNDSLEGNIGDDSLESGLGQDTLIGGKGDDLLIAGNTLDILDGGAGRDLLIASGGGNVLTGGVDPDRFGLNIAQKTAEILDEITDYEVGEKIVIQTTTATNDIDYDPETGILSVNDEEVLQLPIELEIDLGDIEFVILQEEQENPTADLVEFLNEIANEV